MSSDSEILVESNLTKKGMDLLTKVTQGDGKKLLFTKLQVGDGQIGNGDPLQLEALINPVKDVAIKRFKNHGDGTSSIMGTLSNSDISTGFFINEYGVFAQDPDTEEEILYSYTYITYPNFFPAYNTKDFGTILVENDISIVTVIARAKDIQVIIDKSTVYVTSEEFEKYKKDDSTKIEVIPKGEQIALNQRKSNNFYFQVL